MMTIRQAICPLQQFYYRHHGIHGAGVCNHHDVRIFILYSQLGKTLKNKFRCTPLGTKVAIYHFVGNFMLKPIGNVFNLTTCAENM